MVLLLLSIAPLCHTPRAILNGMHTALLLQAIVIETAATRL
jgi:hypothetical protein